uniref:ABC transporter B family member 8 n=1 Tax=Ananas comosus var. bracteatus TaxID=296719 RepID=A0A6V7PH56_ANACO|nr:unnamed protein product [Ananas comosus var. bracteatus]
MALPEVKHFTEASVAAARILDRINRVPKIDSSDPTGLVPSRIRGEIEFDSPPRPGRPDRGPGGASGSGKSTMVGLVQRFYDADEGAVRIDGVDLRRLGIGWIRARMGLVSQDHALFGASVRENILLGKVGASAEEMYAAAMAANAHGFITQLPEGYDTKIGEGGALLSGGQKQRIAIARAVIKNPAILLLDEATSALDSESEKLVQNALDQASMGRTTLVVAHKLSTVKNADQIAVIDSGTIVEVGTHDELLARTASTRGPTSHLSLPPSFSRLLAMNSREWKQALIGGTAAVVYGSLQPIYAFAIGGMIAAFFLKDRDEMAVVIRRYALIFSSLSVISFVVNLLQHYNFAYMGEHLTRRIRVRVLEKILTFEPAWFDEEPNSSAALCSRLSNEASLVKTLVADRISLLVQTASGVAVAVTMGLAVAWKLALVMIAVQPSTVVFHYLKKIVLSNASHDLARAQHKSTQIAIEAVRNHRMVTSFGCSAEVLRLFEEAQEKPLKPARRMAWAAGWPRLLAVPVLPDVALDFWYGGKLAQSGQISAGDVFKTFFILVSTGKLIAEAGSMTSDLAKGTNAVAAIFEVLDRQTMTPRSSQVDHLSEKTTLQRRIQGRIEIKKVDFAYPSRPQCLVLREFNLEVKAGMSRSRQHRLRQARSHRERDRRSRKGANAHEFVSSLTDGYGTDCGERGIQLSGGQKQRIAIARAIIRNPTILLLDEATSALDVQSERAVQEALDRIMVGRTTVVVAHRMNTIKGLDSIAFVGEGRV